MKVYPNKTLYELAGVVVADTKGGKLADVPSLVAEIWRACEKFRLRIKAKETE